MKNNWKTWDDIELDKLEAIILCCQHCMEHNTIIKGESLKCVACGKDVLNLNKPNKGCGNKISKKFELLVFCGRYPEYKLCEDCLKNV